MNVGGVILHKQKIVIINKQIYFFYSQSDYFLHIVVQKRLILKKIQTLLAILSN